MKLLLNLYNSGPLIQQSTIPANFQVDSNSNPNLNSDVSTVVRICTMDFRNSGLSE